MLTIHVEGHQQYKHVNTDPMTFENVRVFAVFPGSIPANAQLGNLHYENLSEETFFKSYTRKVNFAFTMANFFAPLQLICRSFVFIVFLLEFFCNIFVLLKQNIHRQILLFSFKNFVSKYKIIAKVNFLINPFAKKLQVL